MHRKWPWWLASVLAPALIATAWVGYRSYQERHYRAELEGARRDLASGRLILASGRLEALVALRPTDGEASYQLGLCEQARGRTEAAIAAWSTVPAGSPFAAGAAVRRARLLVDAGRFTPAEALLEPLAVGPGPIDAEVRQTLELLYRIEGRDDQVRRLILGSWSGSTDPSLVLKRLERLDHAAYPIGIVRQVVGVGDPSDDRVWLARANLARSSGQLDEAARCLAKCRQSRPDDPAVWLSALHLALAMDNPSGVLDASSHLPAGSLSEPEAARLRCWLAARGDDRSLELKALQDLVALEPGDIASWDRLAELATLRGDRAGAQSCRLRLAEMNELRERYKAMIGAEDRAKSAAELARVAGLLGRETEARGWSLIAKGVGSREPLDSPKSSDRSGPSLQDRLRDVRRPTGRVAGRRDGPEPVTPAFADEGRASGLDFVYHNGHRGGRQPPPPEAMGGGVGLVDYDGDGLLDVYLVQGGPFPFVELADVDGDRLFRNRGDGHFEDVTGRSGIARFPKGYGHGVTVGDVDNDGRPDLFVTRWRGYALYRNRGDGTFEDATEAAGLGGDRDWPTSAAFADLDNDGDLDLYVCHYLDYDEANPRRCHHPEAPSRHDCSPIDFKPRPDHAFRNDGGRFVDVTEAAGLSEHTGRGLGVVAADLDGDGAVDLYVANDMSANFLYRNLGGFRFEEVGLASGAAASADGGYKAGMGIACGDLDGDGLPDLAVTNFYGESTTLYLNLGGGTFADHTEAVGLGASTRTLLGFGIAFLDADNDGRLDVLSANGHVIDGRPQYPWMMPLQLLQQRPGGRLVDVSGRAGKSFGPEHLARGLAEGDLDNDGRVDAIVVCQEEPVAYLRNRTGKGGHYATFQLAGKASNRQGIGSVVTVIAGDRRWTAPRFGGGSYQSSGDPRLHFGLGSATRIDRVEVRWPSGRVDHFRDLDADAAYLLREGETQASPLPGWRRPSEAKPR